MPFLHTSKYDGSAILAVISEEVILDEGHHVVLDAEIVDSFSQADRWFNQQIATRPWGGRYVQEDDSLYVGASR